MALLFITHNLGVAAEMQRSHRGDMRRACVVEEGDTCDIFTAPRHPYTRGLLRSIPRLRGTGTEDAELPDDPGQRADARLSAYRLRIPPALWPSPGWRYLATRLYRRPKTVPHATTFNACAGAISRPRYDSANVQATGSHVGLSKHALPCCAQGPIAGAKQVLRAVDGVSFEIARGERRTSDWLANQAPARARSAAPSCD